MARRHREVLDVLISDIVAGVVPAGEQLPRETDLVEQYEVSRGVVREVIRALEERRLVAVKHGKGATVQDSSRWDMLDADVLGAVLRSSSEGAVVLGEYLECRQILEIEATGLAAERASDDDIELLKTAFERMERAARLPSSAAAEELYLQADLDFHKALIGCTGNRALTSLVDHIHQALLTARHPTARPEFRIETSLPEHRAILAAVQNRRPKAARKAMANHLATTIGYLEEYAKGPAVGSA